VKKLLALIFILLATSLAQAQNPQAVRFPKGLKTDSTFSLNGSLLLFRVEAGRTVLKMFDDSTIIYTGNVRTARFSSGTMSLYKSDATNTILLDGESGISRFIGHIVVDSSGSTFGRNVAINSPGGYTSSLTLAGDGNTTLVNSFDLSQGTTAAYVWQRKYAPILFGINDTTVFTLSANHDAQIVGDLTIGNKAHFDGSKLDITDTVFAAAASGYAFGAYVRPIIKAQGDDAYLISLWLGSTFDKGAFTGVKSYGVYQTTGDANYFASEVLLGALTYSTPTNTYGLTVARSTKIDSLLYVMGNVVVGTTTDPTTGKVYVAGKSNQYGLHIKGYNGGTSSYGALIDAGTTTDFAMLVRDYATTNNILAVRGDGNIGVNTLSPDAKIHIAPPLDAANSSNEIALMRISRTTATDSLRRTGNIYGIYQYIKNNPDANGTTGTSTTGYQTQIETRAKSAVGLYTYVTQNQWDGSAYGAYLLGYAPSGSGSVYGGYNYAISDSGNAYAVYGSASSGHGTAWAGYFNGKVNATSYYAGEALGYITSAYGTKTAFSTAEYLVIANGTATTQVYKRAITINGVTVNVLVTD
jgi:hypothetical protein